MVEPLFNFFNEELDALRTLGTRFAERHPKIAGRLRLSRDSVDDPHVARLIESFAFIAARLRLKLDDDFPELTETLLEFLYPHYLAPIPSLCIASAVPNVDLTGLMTLDRGTIVESEPIEGDACRFRTTQAIDMWPVQVVQAALSGQPLTAPAAPHLEALSSLRLVLECTDPKVSFTDLGIDRLGFYLRAPWRHAVALYELLINDCIGIAFADHPEDQAAVFVGPEALRPIGLDDSEAALPRAPRGHPAFRLLTEFFAYPQKFLFIELSRLGAKSLRKAGNRLEIFFYFRRTAPDLERAINAEVFALNCAPIVNLFEQRAEPIMLSRALAEYAIVPDARRHATREVYSVDHVTVADRSGAGRVATPLFGQPIGQEDGLALHWQLRRRRLVDGDLGTDARIALVDATTGADSPTDSVLTVEATCLNRDLVTRLPYGGGQPVLKTPRSSGDAARFLAMTPFTRTLRLTSDEGLFWRLLSHLKLGHLSLVDGKGGPDAFREMMRLYDYRDAPETRSLIDAIVGVTSQRSTARVAGGLARGLDVEIEMDTRSLEPGVAFLFGEVLDRFLGLYVNMNSFTRLTLRLRGVSRPVKTWAPRSGEKVLA